MTSIGGQPATTTGAVSNAPKSAVKAASASTTSSTSTSQSSTSSSNTSSSGGKPRSMEILEIIMDPKNAEKMSFGYDSPQDIANWYKRKNEESQAAWMGYQGKQQTAAMLGQAISAGASALGQMMAGMSKGSGAGRGGPGGAATAAAGKGGGGCPNGQCGRSAAAQAQDTKTASTEAWTKDAGATDTQVASTSTLSPTIENQSTEKIAQADIPKAAPGANTNIAPEALTQREAISQNASMDQIDFRVAQVETPTVEIPPEPIQQPEPPPPPEVIV